MNNISGQILTYSLKKYRNQKKLKIQTDAKQITGLIKTLHPYNDQ
jgi:hypothetical protein